MRPPDNAQLFELPTATCWFDAQGIFCMRAKRGNRTIASSQPMIELCRGLAEGGSKLCVLSDMNGEDPVPKDVRDYVNAHMGQYLNAVAVISTSEVARAMAHLYFTFTIPPYPTRIFSDEAEARDWLKLYL